MSTLTASLQNGVMAFGRWWRDELTQLLPATLRSRLQHRQLLPVVAYDETSWALWQPSLEHGRAARVLRGKLDMAGDAETRQSLARAAIARLESPVALALPPTMVLRRTLTLPSALEENLKQALAYDLDRHTPFRSEDLYFDAQVVGRNTERGEIQVELAAVQRVQADQAIAKLREVGAEVVAVLADPPEKIGSKLNLLPSEDRPAWLPWQRWAIAGGAALILLLLVAAIAFPVWQKRAHAIHMKKQADAAHEQAMEVDHLHNELDRLVADYDFVLEQKTAYPSTVHILEEITRLLPDDTWLTQMEVKTAPGGKELRRDVFLRGESAHASRLVTLLEESGLVTQAAPRSPITTIRGGTADLGEMFDIGAQIKRLPLPERVAVVTSGEVVAPPMPPQQPVRPAAPPTPQQPPVATPSTPAPAAATPPVPQSAPAVPPAPQPTPQSTTPPPTTTAPGTPPPPTVQPAPAPPAVAPPPPSSGFGPAAALKTEPPVEPSSVPVVPNALPMQRMENAAPAATHALAPDSQEVASVAEDDGGENVPVASEGIEEGVRHDG